MFPNYPDKYLKEPIFTPADFIGYLKKAGKYPKFNAPLGMIFSYQKSLLEYVVKNHKTTKMDSTFGEIYLLNDSDRKVGIVGKLGIGAPGIVTATEELIVWGVKEFISIGTAGTLQKNLKVGDIVVCDKAVRDEGVSYHYLKPEKYSYASKEMVEKITRSLERLNQKFCTGASWTIDAPYRETIEEARKYQKEGVLTVDMEAAALFAVAQYRKVEMGAIFTISDSLADLKWQPDFYHQDTKQSLELLYKIAMEVLLE